jgi:hypothetical protein
VFSTVNILCICAIAQAFFFQIDFDLSPVLAEPAHHTHLFSPQVSHFQFVYLYFGGCVVAACLTDRPIAILCLVVSGTRSDELNIKVSPLPDAVPLTYNYTLEDRFKDTLEVIHLPAALSLKKGTRLRVH